MSAPSPFVAERADAAAARESVVLVCDKETILRQETLLRQLSPRFDGCSSAQRKQQLQLWLRLRVRKVLLTVQSSLCCHERRCRIVWCLLATEGRLHTMHGSSDIDRKVVNIEMARSQTCVHSEGSLPLCIAFLL